MPFYTRNYSNFQNINPGTKILFFIVSRENKWLQEKNFQHIKNTYFKIENLLVSKNTFFA